MRYCPRCGATTEASVCPTDGTPTVRHVSPSRRGLQGGDVIGGRYRILGELGRGGFGVVYDALHVTTGHPVAVKILTPTPGDEGQEMARRFFQEASATSRLSHPNTVRVFDFGQTDGGDLFLAMERLNGETLAALLLRNQRESLFVTEAQTVDIGVAVLRSLGEAHANGLVHRDMKPANVFLHTIPGGDSIVKVLDFGIVKDVDTGMTQAGKALGTPTHMSPEQAMGRVVDARADLYALGVVLFECLAGRLPYEADSPLALVMKHVTESVPLLRDRAPGRVRPVLAGVIEKALAKNPDDRWQSALDLRNALQAAMGQGAETGMYRMPPIAAAPPPLPVELPPPLPRAAKPSIPEPTPAPTPHMASWLQPGTPSPIPSAPRHDNSATSWIERPSLLQDEDDAASIVEVWASEPEDETLVEPPTAQRAPQAGMPPPRVTLEPAPPLQARVESRRTPPEALPVPQQPDRGDVLRSLQTPEIQGAQMAGAAWDVRGMMTGRRMPMDMMALASRLGDLRPDQMLQQFQELTRGLAEPANRLRAAAQGLSALALADDGRRALLITQDGVVRVVHVGELDDEPVLGPDLPGQIEVGTHPSLVTATVGSPDGRLVVTGGVDGHLRLWDASSCVPLAEIEVDAGVSALAISTDGKLLIAGCQDGAAHLLELPTLTLRRTLRGHREAVTAVAAAGSRRLVVTGGEDGIVRTWDPVGGGARLTSRGHEGTIGALAVSANGQLVVSGGWDGKVLCWYSRTGEMAQQWQAHGDVIAGLAIDRSGTFCATASDDRSVSVWRLATGDRMAERRDFTAGAKCVAFLDGENAVIAGSWDGTVRKIVW